MEQDNPKYGRTAKEFFSTQEAADMTGLNQTTLTLWIRNKMIDDSKIKRDSKGRRLWSKADIEQIKKVKDREGWQ
jgi:DNA-binding transcriptional MerR regulator